MKRTVATCVLAAALCAGAAVNPPSRVDELVNARQRETGFAPAELCSDEVFVRRVYLDLLGTLPTADEVRRFLADRRPERRAMLIDELLLRPEFADYRALKWCDLLRVKSEYPGNLWPNAVQAYHRWIRDALRENWPYDRFVRELLTASGSNFRDPPSNFYRPFLERTPRRIFETVALLFMGVRLEHSGWSEAELAGMEAFFGRIGYKKTGEWKEEIVFFDLAKPPVAPVPIGGTPLKLDPFTDPRAAFADWLTAPDNPWFARAAVNRIWYWLNGRGIVHEPDDFRPDRAPWSPELLDYLAGELVDHRYDLTHIYRLILNSDTYQRSSVPTSGNAADEEGFSHYRVRRVDAEVLIDAIVQITGVGEEYSSAIPEPFTYLPPSRRTILLADGSINSTFLDLFGRPGRDSSLELDRNNSPSVFQQLHLLNSSHIQNKIIPPVGRAPRRVQPTASVGPERIEQLYLTVLSRPPSPQELQTARSYMAAAETPESGYQDLLWALINSCEFILKH
jgi:hypothetical protein